MANSLPYSAQDLQAVHRALLDELSDMVTITDIEGYILYVNEAVIDLMKLDREAIMGQSVFEIYGDVDFFGSTQEEILDQSLNAGGFRGEIMIYDSTGNPIPCMLQTKLITNEDDVPQYVVGISKSIAGERRAKEALQKTEKKYQQYVKNAPLGVFIVDKAGNYLEVNRAASELTGYSEDELLRMKVTDFHLAEEDEPRIFSTLLEEGFTTEIKKFERKDGSEGWWSINSVKLADDRYMALTADVTELKKLEQELSDSELNLNRAQKVARIGSWSIDLHSSTVKGSRQAHELYGLPNRTLNLAEIRDIPLPEYREQLDRALHDLINHNIPYDEEFKIQRATDGKIFDVHSIAEYNAERHIIFGTIQDITERKEVEEKRVELQRQMQHMQKLESLGLMAGGIAHDFNNLLMAIMGNLELSMAQMKPETSTFKGLENAMSAAKRASKLTLQMLSYAGRAQFHISQMDLNELIRENMEIFKINLGKNVDLKLELNDTIPAIAADVSQIQQVVMNLITNAAEALENRFGTVKIITGVEQLSQSDFQQNILERNPAAGEYIYIEVSDEGVGMDQETQERLFDPFFTTKFTGRGLGMSAVKGIVEGHSGAIFVESELHAGTTIRVLLPRNDTGSESTTEQRDSPPSVKEKLNSFTGKILVVDDEEMVRDVCISMIENLGMEAIQAQDGQSAVRIYQEKSSEISCAIVDYSMPGMDGVETFKELITVDPDIRIILSSGFTEDARLGELRSQGLAGFLHKPYEFDSLRKTLTVILLGE